MQQYEIDGYFLLHRQLREIDRDMETEYLHRFAIIASQIFLLLLLWF